MHTKKWCSLLVYILLAMLLYTQYVKLSIFLIMRLPRQSLYLWNLLFARHLGLIVHFVDRVSFILVSYERSIYVLQANWS